MGREPDRPNPTYKYVKWAGNQTVQIQPISVLSWGVMDRFQNIDLLNRNRPGLLSY